MTCPHCASFHNKIFENLKVDFIDKGLVKFEYSSPLDLAALNAEIIVRCHVDNDKKFKLLENLQKTKKMAIGSDINKINNSIKIIGSETNLSNEKMDSCLENDKSQDEILNQRIEAQKNIKLSLLLQL